jgi:methanogenic corrinoid protein MtbC1
VNTELLIERLFQALISGDRLGARSITNEPLEEGVKAEEVVTQVLWPCYDLIDRLHRSDQITRLAHHLGTRLLRSMVDQLSLQYEQKPDRGRSIFAFSGPTDADELAGQMAQVGEMQPDILLIFASAPSDLPQIRQLIDTIREIGSCTDVQIVVGGGVFNRADGLAEEIGADLWADDPLQLAQRLADEPDRRAADDQRTVGLRRKRREAA